MFRRGNGIDKDPGKRSNSVFLKVLDLSFPKHPNFLKSVQWSLRNLDFKIEDFRKFQISWVSWTAPYREIGQKCSKQTKMLISFSREISELRCRTTVLFDFL